MLHHMNRFLLVAINAKYIHSNPAIYSLRAYAGEILAPYIDLAEYTINQPVMEILGDLYERKPAVIGFSCYIWNREMIGSILREIPKILPDAEIWLGGPEAGFDGPNLLAEYPCVKGVMVGEGEETFRELTELYVKEGRLGEVCTGNGASGSIDSVAGDVSPCETADASGDTADASCDTADASDRTIQFDESLRQIAGLYLRTGYTAYREVMDMNALPFLYEDTEPFANKIIYYESSRGCPYRCSYCLSALEKKLRFRDMSVIKKELSFFLDKKVAQVKFVDRTFNCKHEHAMEIWRYLHEHDNGVTNFHFEISADLLTEEELKLLAKLRPGLIQLEIGVQSANPDTICAIDRVMDLDRLEAVVERIRRGHNIHTHLDLIAGLPYEDYTSFGHSFDRVYAMRPEQLQLGFLKVLKGSPMEERSGEYDLKYSALPPYEVISTKWLSFGDVLALKRIEEMLELFYNSNQFTHTLPFLERVFDSPFAMYEALAEFGRRTGFVNTSARVRKYEFLLAFAAQYDPANEAVYRELLTFDMYLRENCKSRPSFAADPSEEEKERFRAFFMEEEKERRYLPDYASYSWKQLSKMTHLEFFRYPVWDAEDLKNAAHEDAGESDRLARENAAAPECTALENASDLAHTLREDTEDLAQASAGTTRAVLFAYDRRDPLTGEAYTALTGA